MSYRILPCSLSADCLLFRAPSPASQPSINSVNQLGSCYTTQRPSLMVSILFGMLPGCGTTTTIGSGGRTNLSRTVFFSYQAMNSHPTNYSRYFTIVPTFFLLYLVSNFVRVLFALSLRRNGKIFRVPRTLQHLVSWAHMAEIREPYDINSTIHCFVIPSVAREFHFLDRPFPSLNCTLNRIYATKYILISHFMLLHTSAHVWRQVPKFHFATIDFSEFLVEFDVYRY
jgi:hypothetical protein